MPLLAYDRGMDSIMPPTAAVVQRLQVSHCSARPSMLYHGLYGEHVKRNASRLTTADETDPYASPVTSTFEDDTGADRTALFPGRGYVCRKQTRTQPTSDATPQTRGRHILRECSGRKHAFRLGFTGHVLKRRYKARKSDDTPCVGSCGCSSAYTSLHGCRWRGGGVEVDAGKIQADYEV